MFALENICVPCYLRNIVGNFDSRSLPNSGDFDYKILKMSKFPWVARIPTPPQGENIDRYIRCLQGKVKTFSWIYYDFHAYSVGFDVFTSV
jgi:hypothetical protein